MNTKTLITAALGCVILVFPAFLKAQQQESVADAARKAQAAKKTAPKAKLTIDNDNLGTLTGTVSVVGQEPAAPPSPEQAAKSAADDKAAKAGAPAEKAPAKDEAYWRARFAAANKKLADDSHELDIMQREYNLKQQQFYADPMATLKQEYSRQDLNDSKTKIDEKTALVNQDKADIASLDDELRQAGGDPGWAAPPAQPAPASQP
jgi:chromosome segregation ATPase